MTESKHENNYYSNCLIEAIKHKLKQWKCVKITYISVKYNIVSTPHFMWSDGLNDYDFGTGRYLKWHQRFWFNGNIRTRELGWNERYKKKLIDSYRK